VMEREGRGWTADDHASHPAVAEPHWFVLWTRSHCEQLVYEQLATKGLHPFLPTIEVWSRRASLRRRIRIPMFPGYLFLHDALDKHIDVEVRKARDRKSTRLNSSHVKISY